MLVSDLQYYIFASLHLLMRPVAQAGWWVPAFIRKNSEARILHAYFEKAHVWLIEASKRHIQRKEKAET
jgi:hypothetical protein